MKFICSKSNLLNGVNIVSKAVPNRSTMSILECILINTTRDIISLTGNDTELGIETIIDGQIIERGIVALDAKIFSEIVRKLPDDNITIDVDQNYKTLITCGKAHFTIIGKSGEDYTYLPEIEKNNSIILSQLNFRDIVKQTIFSVADGGEGSSAQQTTKGELFEVFGDYMRLSSLDGHRISIRRLQLRDEYENEKVIVPGKSLNEISKIVTGGAEDDIEISFSSNHIIFEFGNTKVVSRLIDGEFFDIDKMSYSNYETKVSINRKDLVDCIDRACLLVKEGDKKPIVLNIKDDMVTMSINSIVGSMNEDLDIEKVGKDIMIAFNPKFLLDALRVIEDDTIDLYMVNAKAPCFIKNEEESYIYVVLPVNFTTVS
ncbi:MAG: DNA polymerase III subunit beta [Lachnospiraceae bacterium]|nr:DNA polymerase III subunit beta [Lachnospiraceae bacterium]MBR1650738.1 DNA polymerase III subunit beta [Lachnospiraceae bacterium]